MPEEQIIQNPELDMPEDTVDPLTFSINQGLHALKEQLNIDLNDIIRNGHLLEGDHESFFNKFDFNNPEISNLLRTPPTIGTHLHTFRHNNDLRNDIDVDAGVSSQSSSSDEHSSVGKNFL